MFISMLTLCIEDKLNLFFTLPISPTAHFTVFACLPSCLHVVSCKRACNCLECKGKGWVAPRLPLQSSTSWLPMAGKVLPHLPSASVAWIDSIAEELSHGPLVSRCGHDLDLALCFNLFKFWNCWRICKLPSCHVADLIVEQRLSLWLFCKASFCKAYQRTFTHLYIWSPQNLWRFFSFPILCTFAITQPHCLVLAFHYPLSSVQTSYVHVLIQDFCLLTSLLLLKTAAAGVGKRERHLVAVLLHQRSKLRATGRARKKERRLAGENAPKSKAWKRESCASSEGCDSTFFGCDLNSAFTCEQCHLFVL